MMTKYAISPTELEKTAAQGDNDCAAEIKHKPAIVCPGCGVGRPEGHSCTGPAHLLTQTSMVT